MSNLVEENLNYLFQQGEYEKAAGLCPQLLQGDKELWKRWVLEFYEHRQIHALVEFIPTDNPRLSQATYDFVLRHFVEYDPAGLLRTIRRWPQVKTKRRGGVGVGVGGSGRAHTEVASSQGEPLYDVVAWIDRLRLEMKQVQAPPPPPPPSVVVGGGNHSSSSSSSSTYKKHGA
jgi:hypothetical protein